MGIDSSQNGFCFIAELVVGIDLSTLSAIISAVCLVCTGNNDVDAFFL